MTADQSKNNPSFINSRVGRLSAIAILLLIVILALEYRNFYAPPALKPASAKFFIRPYLQLGRQPDASDIRIVWAAIDDGKPQVWQVEYRPDNKPIGELIEANVDQSKTIRIGDLPPYKIFSAHIPLAESKADLPYYVKKNGQIAFQSQANRIVQAPDRFRFDVLGDMASGQPSAKQVALGLYRSKPNLVVIPGDIVYTFGRMLEYLDHFFPVYNADDTSLEGVSLLRSTLVVAAPGNHDVNIGSNTNVGNLDRFPDGLAYFVFWKQPLNGPPLKRDGAYTAKAKGSEAHREAFFNAAGDSFPSMTNYSFDIGNAHFTVLDADPYMDWTNKGLRSWLEKDLKGAEKKDWRFVVYHQPSYSSDTHHFREQRMRVVSDIFERYRVDVVFAGHVHNYQRSHPLRFSAKPDALGNLVHLDGTVSGELKLDKSYDGITHKTPDGVIYIVTGCGGAHLTGSEIADNPQRWQPFTQKMLSQFSFSQCDVDGKKLIVRQLTPAGKEIDRFEIDKSFMP